MKTFTQFLVILWLMSLNVNCTHSEANETKHVIQDSDKWYETSAEFLNKVTSNSGGEAIVYPEGQATISSKFVVWKPGFQTGLHKHPVPIAVAIYQGELTVEFENGETLVTKAGGSYVSTPNRWHKSSNKGTEDVIFHLVYMGTDQTEHTVPKKE